MVNPVNKIEMSIKNLSVTFLPEDLLQLLVKARTSHAQGQTKRAEAMLNIIKRVCKKRGIYMVDYRRAPQTVNYRERNLYRGMVIDIKA